MTPTKYNILFHYKLIEVTFCIFQFRHFQTKYWDRFHSPQCVEELLDDSHNCSWTRLLIFLLILPKWLVHFTPNCMNNTYWTVIWYIQVHIKILNLITRTRKCKHIREPVTSLHIIFIRRRKIRLSPVHLT